MLDPKQRQRFLRDNRARIGIGIVVVMTLAAILAPLIARQNPIAIDLAGRITDIARALRHYATREAAC